MSFIIGAFVAIGFLAGLVSTLVAILSPRFRVAACIMACTAFVVAGAAIGMFVFIVSQMK